MTEPNHHPRNDNNSKDGERRRCDRETTKVTGTNDNGGGGGRGRRRSHPHDSHEGYYYIPRKDNAGIEPIVRSPPRSRSDDSQEHFQKRPPAHSRRRTPSATQPDGRRRSRSPPASSHRRAPPTTPDGGRRSRSPPARRRRRPPASPSPAPRAPPARSRAASRRSRSPPASWNGRTRHYARNRRKARSFDAGHPHRESLPRATADDRNGGSTRDSDSRGRHESGRANRRSKSATTSSRHNNNHNNNSSQRAVSTFKVRMSTKDATAFFKHKMLPLVPRIGRGSCKKRDARKDAACHGGSRGENDSDRKERGGGGGDSIHSSGSWTVSSYVSDGSKGSSPSPCTSDYCSSASPRTSNYCSSGEEREASDQGYYSAGCDSNVGSTPSGDAGGERNSAASFCGSGSGHGRSRTSRQLVVAKSPSTAARVAKRRRDRRQAREEEREAHRRGQRRTVRLRRENARLRASVAALRRRPEAGDGRRGAAWMRDSAELARERLAGRGGEERLGQGAKRRRNTLPALRSESDRELALCREEEKERAYRECIEDLLRENERLYHKIETLQEVHALRSSSNYKNAMNGSCGLLTDEETTVSEDTDASIQGRMDAPLEKEGNKRREGRQRDALGKEIVELMSKVRSHQQGGHTVAPDIDDDNQQQKNGWIEQQQEEETEEKDQPKKPAAKNVNDKIATLGLSLCTVLSNSEHVDNEERSGMDSELSYIVVVENSTDVSSNSLFDGTSPSTVGPLGRGGDDSTNDDASTLEIIHEYRDDSDFEGGVAPSYSGKRRQAASVSSSTYRDEYARVGVDARSYGESRREENARYCPDSSYPSFLSDDEMIDCPPGGGYLRYSETSSNYTPYSSGGSAARSVFLSAAALHHHQHQCSKSMCSQSKQVIEDNGVSIMTSDLELEDDKLHVAGYPRRPGGDLEQHGHGGHLDVTAAKKQHRVSTPVAHTGALGMHGSSDNTSNSCPPVSRDSTASTKERQGIGITVVSRASHHESFPSSPAYTYETFFRSSLLKSQVDAIMAEQFQETRPLTAASLPYMGKAQKKRKKYQGEFNKEGKYHGYGIYTSKNGNEYRGEWRNGKREGLGVVKIGNGDIFEGQFENNLKNGIGAYHFLDGECDFSSYRDDGRVGDTVRYSKDRQRAFLLAEGLGSKAISPEEAAQVAQRMGTRTY